MALRIRSIRGPASYVNGTGFNVLLGDIEYISPGSGNVGRKAVAYSNSSSRFFPTITSHSGNIATLFVFDGRSNLLELANATNIAGLDIAILYEGV